MLWIPASFNLGGRAQHCTKGCCHPEMSQRHWSSSSPLRYSCLCWSSGLGHPANPVCPAHTQWAACPAHRKTAPAEKHRSEPWSEQPMEVRTGRPCCLLWQFGEIKTERQNLGSDPCQGQCFSCEGRAAAPTGAGSTRCTGSSLCRPLLSYFKCNTRSCAKPALPTQPHLFPMWWEEITDSKPLSFKNNWQMSQKSKCFPL